MSVQNGPESAQVRSMTRTPASSWRVAWAVVTRRLSSYQTHALPKRPVPDSTVELIGIDVVSNLLGHPDRSELAGGAEG